MKLIFVHGAGGGSDLWRFQTEHFPQSVAVDLPGHPQGRGYQRVEEYVAWLAGYIYGREMAPVVLVGHSMGGAIAQEMALRHPELLQALVLVSTGARLRVAPQIFQALEGDYEKAVDFMLDFAFGPQVDPKLRQEVRRLRLLVPVEVVLGDFRACDAFDLMEEVKAINLPTLIVSGSEDRLTPTKYAQYLHSQIPNSRLELIAGAGHTVMLEKPQAFHRALEGFLASLKA